MIINGYNTDDLTYRQHHYFCKLAADGIGVTAVNFLIRSVRKNVKLNQFKDYPGDCDYLKNINRKILDAKGIDLNTIYD